MLKALLRGWILTILMGFVGSVFADNPSAISSRYETRGDSIYDKKTELIWARCSVGQRWKDGVGCEGAVSKFTFDEAQHLVGGGWRVPSTNELGTLVVEGKTSQALDKTAFPNMDMQSLGYWTSTPDNDAYAWFIFFFDGRIDNVNRVSLKAVRLVRGGSATAQDNVDNSSMSDKDIQRIIKAQGPHQATVVETKNIDTRAQSNQKTIQSQQCANACNALYTKEDCLLKWGSANICQSKEMSCIADCSSH